MERGRRSEEPDRHAWQNSDYFPAQRPEYGTGSNSVQRSSFGRAADSSVAICSLGRCACATPPSTPRNGGYRRTRRLGVHSSYFTSSRMAQDRTGRGHDNTRVTGGILLQCQRRPYRASERHSAQRMQALVIPPRSGCRAKIWVGSSPRASCPMLAISTANGVRYPLPTASRPQGRMQPKGRNRSVGDQLPAEWRTPPKTAVSDTKSRSEPARSKIQPKGSASRRWSTNSS
jgi:hypothetical protein